MKIPDEIYDTYHIYRTLVDTLTKVYVISGEIVLKSGETIDHILPASFGFNWKLPPTLIADKRNLQILSKYDNAKKSYKCEIIPKFIQKYMINTHHNTVKNRIKEGIQRAKDNGVYTGRVKGSVESEKDFLNKPKIKEVIEYLDLGYRSTDIIKVMDVHVNTITKVKKILKMKLGKPE